MIDIVKKHNRGAVRAGKTYAGLKPWRGSTAEKFAKMLGFLWDLCSSYGIEEPTVARGPEFGSGEAAGFFDEHSNTIVLTGGFSVMAFLRLFATCLEFHRGSEYSDYDINVYAARWANGLFKKSFPKSWDKLVNRDAAILDRNYS